MIDAAIENGVEKVLALSTDKAVNPIHLRCHQAGSREMMVQSNAYAGGRKRASPARVMARGRSRDQFFSLQRPTGVVTITDDRMTRF